MRRTIAFAAVWVVAAAIALAVAWQGVSVVGDQVTDDRPAPLAAGEIERRLEAAAAAGASTTSSSVGEAADPASPTTSSAPKTTAPTAPPPASAAPAGTPTTAVPATSPPAGETRTYPLRGGTATLRFLPSGVEVVFANPAAGFHVEWEPEHGNGVKVEFESDSHESRVDAWWDGGPQDRVREEPAD